MWKWWIGSIIVAAVVIAGTTHFRQVMVVANAPVEAQKEAPKPEKSKVDQLMARKLGHSQKLLEALVKNDFDKAIAESEELLRVRKEAAWLVVKTKMYNTWSEEFAQSAERVIKAAKDKNLDAAKLGYLELTVTCFNCHAYVRDLGDANWEGLDW